MVQRHELTPGPQQSSRLRDYAVGYVVWNVSEQMYRHDNVEGPGFEGNMPRIRVQKFDARYAP